MFRRLGALVIVGALSLGMAMPTFGADQEKKFVLQISDGGADKQTLVLNVANNLQTHYGVDKVKVEIVAFGPGLRLLFKDNTNTNRIASLSQTGVQFSACQNTLKGMTKQLGHAPELNKMSVPVVAGVARIAELSEQGYLLIRP
jgi:intracellular sulfur oxidation DsrE/DsrF family protein